MRSGSRHLLFWAVAGGVVALDILTKLLAVATLGGGHRVRVLGDWLFLRLVYNPGAAFGIAAGPPAVSRIVFMVLAVMALLVLGTMVQQTPPTQRVRLTALALMGRGA